MNSRNPLDYMDRRTGRIVTEPVYAGRFLQWAHNSAAGRLLTDLLFSRRVASRAYGWLHNRSWSRRKIRPFAEKLNVDMRESLRGIDEFASFNDFFTREIDLSGRPIDSDPRTCVAPADGRVLAFSPVRTSDTFVIKGSPFDLAGLLGDKALARRFSGGSVLIVRLYLADYHHFHFPDSGVPAPALAIPGRYYPVSPYSTRPRRSFYAENFRMRTLFDSDHFGRIAMVEIGAFTVGSIRQCYPPGAATAKGAHKGFFEVGGSTVVLVFEKGAIRFDDDLPQNTRSGLETYVRLGESVGRVIAPRRSGDTIPARRKEPSHV